jgi:hypothetical protein
MPVACPLLSEMENIWHKFSTSETLLIWDWGNSWDASSVSQGKRTPSITKGSEANLEHLLRAVSVSGRVDTPGCCRTGDSEKRTTTDLNSHSITPHWRFLPSDKKVDVGPSGRRVGRETDVSEAPHTRSSGLTPTGCRCTGRLVQ